MNFNQQFQQQQRQQQRQRAAAGYAWQQQQRRRKQQQQEQRNQAVYTPFARERSGFKRTATWIGSFIFWFIWGAIFFGILGSIVGLVLSEGDSGVSTLSAVFGAFIGLMIALNRANKAANS